MDLLVEEVLQPSINRSLILFSLGSPRGIFLFAEERLLHHRHRSGMEFYTAATSDRRPPDAQLEIAVNRPGDSKPEDKEETGARSPA